jgi:hypothetical protein
VGSAGSTNLAAVCLLLIWFAFGLLFDPYVGRISAYLFPLLSMRNAGPFNNLNFDIINFSISDLYWLEMKDLRKAPVQELH